VEGVPIETVKSPVIPPPVKPFDTVTLVISPEPAPPPADQYV